MAKYDGWTLGETEALLNVVGGTDVARSVLRGERKLTIEEVARQLPPPAPKPSLVGLQTTYDQDLGLAPLIEGAVGPTNVGNINRNITEARFPFKGQGVRQVNLRVEPYLNGETSEQIYRRLAGKVPGFGNTGDLAAYLRDHPQEVAKWAWVLAISEDSRWSHSDGNVLVPYAYAFGAYRYFNLNSFRDQLDSLYGVLVLGE